MKKILLHIVGLSYSQTQTGAFALVLGEAEGRRRLPIIIGNFEAQAIAIKLEDMKPNRPLTHDVFKTFADSFGIDVKEVIIYNLVEGIFFAKIICFKDTQEIEIDARTSDAIALAVRFDCPIYTYNTILESAGIIIDDDKEDSIQEFKQSEEIPKPVSSKKTFASLSKEQLETELQQALDNEDYERASLIRDEIKSRTQS